MKKLLIILIGCLILPLMVSADMGAPENMSYEIEITNATGTAYYEMTWSSNQTKLVKIGTIPKGEKFTIYYEENINGMIYATVTYKNKTGYIKISDTTITTEEIELDDESVTKLEKPIKRTVLSNNLTIHTSPANAFKTIGTIPKGEEIKLTYSAGDTWYYVEYNGIKGWVEGYNGTLGKYIDKEILFINDHKMYSKPNNMSETSTSNLILTIPTNTKINGYYELDDWTTSYYVEYQDQEGYISDEKIGIKRNKKLKLFKDVQAFNTIEDAENYAYEPEKNKSSITIPKDTELTELYYYIIRRGIGGFPYYQVKYNGKEYWIVDNFQTDDNDFFTNNSIATIENKTIKILEDIYVYETPEAAAKYGYDNNNKEVVATIKKNEEIKLIYSFNGYHYIETKDGINGWIMYYISSDNDEDYFSDEKILSKDNEDDEIEVEEKGLSKEELMYICIGGAIALALTILVIIIIINKKRNKQNI